MKRVWAMALVAAATSCAADGDGDSGSGDGADGATGLDSADAADGADGTGAGLTDPPLPDWPSEQPGLTDPESRKWFRAGEWYRENPDELDTQMKDLFASAADGQGLGDPQAIIVPHAGTKACGATAAKTWSKIRVPDTVIIMAPNHIDVGKRAAIWNAGPWLIPGLAIPTREDIVERLLELLPEDLEVDQVAFEHQNAHPSEMPLVYLSRKNPNIKIVQISFFDDEKADYVDFDEARVERVGLAVAKVVQELQEKGEKVLLLGSVDLSHYELPEISDPKDADMMDRMERFDIAGLRTAVVDGNYTICSEIAVSVLMVALKELGYTGLDVAIRGDSSVLSGPGKAVVGYPGGIVWR